MQLNVLLEKSSLIYSIIKANTDIQTFMQIPPQQPLVEIHLASLGYPLKDKGKKSCTVNLSI